MKVLVLYDQPGESQRPDEADAMTQVRAIQAALEQLGHEWMTLGITLDLDAAKQAITQLNPDVVFNLCESLGGSARLLHVPCDLLDSMAVPYTGASALGQLLTTNKLSAKRMLRFGGLPTATWYTADDLTSRTVPIEPGRYIIKSVWEHASIGLDDSSIAEFTSGEDLRASIQSRTETLGGYAFAEKFIDGREFNLAMMAGESRGDPLLLPPAEITFENYPAGKPKIIDYGAKWDEESFSYHHTRRRFDFPANDQQLIKRLQHLCVECWKLFELRGYARVDFRVDDAGQPWILEVNTDPCLSPDAGFAAALERAGISFHAAIARLLDDAIRATPRIPVTTAPL